MRYTRRIEICGCSGGEPPYGHAYYAGRGEMLMHVAAEELTVLRERVRASGLATPGDPRADIRLVLHALMRAAEGTKPGSGFRDVISIILTERAADMLDPPHEGGEACSP